PAPLHRKSVLAVFFLNKASVTGCCSAGSVLR
ncbi:hypothetical protein EC960428_1294, partial [Escherichia coli 96.0428]